MKRHISVMIGFSILIIFLVLSLFPQIAPHDPYRMDKDKILQAPSTDHILGTDEVGRDILSLVIYGARISLLVGFFAAGISTIIGVVVGIFSGYYDRSWGQTLMRLTDVFLAVPQLPLMLVLELIQGL